jgi:integrase
VGSPESRREKRALRASTVSRYLYGIGKDLLEVFEHLPPSTAQEHPEEVGEALEALKARLMAMESTSPPVAAMSLFARFVAASGGPNLPLDDEWGDIEAGEHVRINMLGPVHFLGVLKRLDARTLPHSFERLRLRGMAILGMRLGMRWGEIQHVRLKDMHIERVPQTGRITGDVAVRPTAHANPKNAQSIRQLWMDAFIPQDEMDNLLELYRLSSKLPGRANDRERLGYLFCDPDAPDLPPRRETTNTLIVQAMRQETLDPELVFHTLRHSAATITLLRLYSHPFGHVLHKLVPGLKELEEGCLLPDGLGACLSMRSNEDRSRLYQISSLLGHIDPSSTARYYLHLMDLVVHLQILEHQRDDRRAEAAIDGVLLSTIHKRRYRSRKRTRVKHQGAP